MIQGRPKGIVEASAPTRIDLAGGTVDLWPLYLFHPGAVTINVAIDLRAWVRIEPGRGPEVYVTDQDTGRRVSWEDVDEARIHRRYKLFRQALCAFPGARGLHIRFGSQAPAGAGLAGSSAMMVAFCGALMKSVGEPVRPDRFLALVRDLETRLIGVPAGMQDYYPALWGGVHALQWEAGGVVRERMAGCERALEDRILLVYSGRSRRSGVNNWEILKRHLDGDRTIRNNLDRIVEAGRALYEALRKEDYQEVGRAMAQEARARSRLYPGILTPEVRELQGLLKRRGVIGIKVCGAGGGGCVVAYGEPGTKERLAKEIQSKGYEVLPFKIVGKGLSFRTGTGQARRARDHRPGAR